MQCYYAAKEYALRLRYIGRRCRDTRDLVFKGEINFWIINATASILLENLVPYNWCETAIEIGQRFNLSVCYCALRLQLLLDRASICRFRVSALRLRSLLEHNLVYRVRVVAITIVTGFCNFFLRLELHLPLFEMLRLRKLRICNIRNQYARAQCWNN